MNNNNNKHNTDYCIISRYERPNLFTPLGAYLNAKKLEKRGFPNINYWRFITFTYPHGNFLSPALAYKKLRPRFAKILYDLRQVYGNFEYMLKCELHEDGYPHWHLLASIKKKIRFDIISKRWNFSKNCVDYDYVKPNSQESSMHYLLKYSLKSNILPAWLSDSRERRRFLSFSKGFFINKKVDSPVKPKVKKLKVKKSSPASDDSMTLRERLEHNKFILLVQHFSKNGVRFSKVEINLKYGFHQLATFINRSVWSFYDKNKDDVPADDYLHKSWVLDNRAKIKNPVGFFSFLLANNAISKKNVPLIKKVLKTLQGKNDFKERASTDDFIYLKTDDFLNNDDIKDEMAYEMEIIKPLTLKHPSAAGNKAKQSACR